MKILLTGVTGYIGKRLLPTLIREGHQVVCCVRDINRFVHPKGNESQVEVIEVDLLKPDTLQRIPKDIDAAYYLVHSMSSSRNYEELETSSARNFREALEETSVEQVIYLSGIVNENSLSKHLNSRLAVEVELGSGYYHLTVFRAGIIIGSGSASFEIIRDLVEKLPIMVAPKWLNTRCQPIGIVDVINYLFKSLHNLEVYDKSFDIGGPEVLNYREMLLGFAKVRRLKRWIFIVPVMTPRLSSYWLYFITSTSYKLATALVDSMSVEVTCRKSPINEILKIKPMDYQTALNRAFSKIQENQIISSWKDSLISGRFDENISEFIKVPTYGCFRDERQERTFDEAVSIERIWSIGGQHGWYYANWLWRIRGFIDKLSGGVGLRRGRTNEHQVHPGDSIDFWRVLYANRAEGRLLMFAEMKLPGEAWLEFNVSEGVVTQTATFRPRGVWGRLYWYSVLPFHGLIFKGMLAAIAE